MNAPANWEDILRSSRFDLPQERWDAMESRLRQRIREDRAATAAKAARPSLSDRLRETFDALSSWIAPAPVRWAGAGALGLLVLGSGIALWNRSESPALTSSTQELRWNPGETLEAVGQQEWEWAAGRSQISLRDGEMHLERASDGEIRIHVERGTASFQVDHRSKSESFHVGFGACHIEVVGTRFTIAVDSATSTASVQDGRVRFLGPGRDRLLEAGQELSCTPPAAAAPPSPARSTAPGPAARPASSKSADPKLVATPSAADLAFEKLQLLCRSSGATCTEARADFVRRFPSDDRAIELGWEWGQAARVAGDFRDALFAWDVAARSTRRIGVRATIAAAELRLSELPDARRASQDLDRILPALEAGSTMWVRAWTLRRDAARILGDAPVVRWADSLLAVPHTASGGP